jgi:O-antigen/teichoic acid export membrane protein
VGEAGIRLIVVIGVALVAASVGALAIASTLAMATWVVFLLVGKCTVRGARLEGGVVRAVSRMAQSVLASAASALIVTGFPLLLVLSSRSDDNPARLAVVVLVVTLTRAPIMLPLNAFLGMLVTSFVERKADGPRVVGRPIVATFLATLVLSVVAGLVGPPLLVLMFGLDYEANGLFIGAATLAAGMIGAVSITGTAVLAQGRHAEYSLGWLCAAAVSFALMFLPLEVEARTIVALVAGPLVGALVHSAALFRRPRRQPQMDPMTVPGIMGETT